MKQSAPEPEPLIDLVERLTYKPGWMFFLQDIDRGQESSGLTLIIRTSTQNSDEPEKTINVLHYMIVPAASYDERSWRRWLFDQICLVERHEAAEFFRIDNVRAYAPAHQPGSDPYIIFEPGSATDRTTNFLGESVTEGTRHKE